MFSHVMLGAEIIEDSQRFYDATLGALGVKPGKSDSRGRVRYVAGGGLFMLSKPINGETASGGNGSTVGFAAETPEHVEAWHAAGLANGGTTCEDPPGVRIMSLEVV